METKQWIPPFPLLNDYILHWADKTPNKIAIIQHEDGREVTYLQLRQLIDYFALRLLDAGITKGDRISTQMVLFPEHIALCYACLRIGAIFAPIDLRLKPHEVKRDLDKIEPKLFFTHGKTPAIDFNQIAAFLMENCPYIEQVIQAVPPEEKDNIVEGALSIQGFMDKGKLAWLKIKDAFTQKLKKAYAQIDKRTPAIIIFTTGTTGAPKPAVLCHENVIVQNEIIARGSNGGMNGRMLVNLPVSHVGCLTECTMTPLYTGSTTIFLKAFSVEETLKAVEKHKATTIGQIPTQFRMLWNHPEYGKFNLSSLTHAIYAGSSVDVNFLHRLYTMAPQVFTGLGMTESAGFVTFTPPGISPEEMSGQVGRYFDDVAKVTVRESMNEDGTAGKEVPLGENGEICYHPPIVFLGYYNNKEATDATISKEGILYTGDLGYFKKMNGYNALYLNGRRKFVIKQKGYQVFPTEVENHILTDASVAEAVAVGVKHKMFDEGIFVFVKPKPGMTIDVFHLMEHCKDVAAYKRPQHIEVWPADKSFPINRVAKVDVIEVQKEAYKVVERLQAEGGWDSV